MAYSGPGKNPYWMSLTYGGTANPTAVSEKMPVVVDNATTYALYTATEWENGTNNVTFQLKFLDGTGAVLSTITTGAVSVTNSALALYNTTPTVAPANAASAQAFILHNVTNDNLRVYYAAVQTANNTAQPAIVNRNYIFNFSYDPWTAVNGALLQWNFDVLDSGDGDADSLVIDNLMELMGGTPVFSSIPELTDYATSRSATYRILTTGNAGLSVGSGASGPYDLGAPQPTADVIESLLLDGERPFGTRASNRKITIPVMIFAPTLITLAAAREMLLKTIDQQTWKLTWKPASSGLPLEFECFRADPTVVTYGFNYNREGAAGNNIASWALSVVTITFQALPYGKSGQDGTQVVSFADGVLDGGSVTPSVLLDDYTAPQVANDFEGGTNGATISVANSGTVGVHVEDAFSAVTLTSTGTAVYDNTQSYPPNTGMSALVGNGVSAGTSRLIYSNTGVTTTTQYFRFYVRLPAYPTSGTSQLMAIQDAGGNCATVTVDSTGKIGMGSHTVTTVIATTNAVPLNTWCRISGFLTVSATAGQVGFSVYYTNPESSVADETKLSAATQNTGTGPLTNWLTGILSGVANFSYNVDNVAVASPVALGAYTASGIASFSSAGGGTWVLNTAYAIGGSQSVRYSAPIPAKSPWAAAVYTASNLVLNLSGLTGIYLWFGQSFDTQWPMDKKFVSNVTFAWTLTDVNGRTLSFSGKADKCPWGADPNKPTWTRTYAAIPQGRSKTQFDYSKVTAYSIRITNWAGSGTTGYAKMHAWISRAIAVASTNKWVATQHASVYSVFGLSGIARTPFTATVQLPASNPVTQEITQTGTWTVPKGVTQVSAEGWGGGGGGGSVSGVTNGMDAGGGGGGEYSAESAMTTIPGTKIPVTIGAGGSGGQVVVRTVTFTKSGVNTWTAPGGVTVITAELWGGGAAGAAGGGGGGGGSYNKGTVNVTAGNTYRIFIGPGGKANTGKLAKDQAARHGGDTTVSGDTGTLHAPGGSSPTTGGTPGGTGGVRQTAAESGTTITFSSNGGNGGNSPGSAGGGGGTSGGRTAAGIRGGDSPRGSNNYASGGPSTTSADAGGTGGKGADSGGTPGKGSQPGGGGGGGYTKTTNYAGASGGDGKVIITYQENLGNPVNGGQTIFGQIGLTNKVLTANGGASPALNTATGGVGGTGSANTVHFNGGKGAMSGNNSDYLYRESDNGGSGWVRQNTGVATATSVTSGTATASLSTGIAIVAAKTINPVFSTTSTCTDLAGNNYDCISQVQLPSSGAYLSVWVAKIGAPLVSSTTTVTLAVAGTAQTNVITWFTSPQYADIDFASLATGAGTSTAPAVTWSNADVGSRKGTFMVTMNNSTTDTSSQPANANWLTADTTTSSKFVSTTTEFAFFSKELPGGSGNITATSTLASSVAWAMIALPLIPQDVASPYPMKVTRTNSTGTTCVLSFTNGFGVPAARGYMLMTVEFAGAPGTITFTDATGNTWTQRGTVAAGTATMRAYTAPATAAYTTASTVTLNDTTNQAHAADLYYIHEAAGIDTALDKTATGTSTSPGLTTNAGTFTSDLEMLILANNNSVAPTANPAGFISWANDSSGTMNYSTYAVRVLGRNTYVATGTYAASQTWGALAFGFTSNIALGSGASSGGPLGPGNDGTDSGGTAWEGGGKGANALVSVVGAGAPAAIPGGGGSGAASSDTSAFVGGSGASGMVRLTWSPPLNTFNDLILHRPSEGAPNSLCPVIMIPPNDPPDNREYAVPSLVTGKNAEFRGTYSVLLVANAWNTSTTGSSRRVSVTVNQYEYKNGPAVSVQATRVITPATDIVNGYVDMGSLTLPIRDYDESNDDVYYTVSVHDTDTGDSFQDVLFLDTMGQTCLVNIAPGTASDGTYSTFYIDEPSTEKGLGQVLGSGYGRERAVSVLDMAMLSGGPLYLNQGENLLLAYSTGGAPNLGVTYSPRWYTDRIK